VTAFNGYPVSIFFAVLFHSLIIGFVLYFERAETEVLDVIRPPVVKAILVNENPQARNEQVQQQREIQRVQDQRATQRRAEQQQQQQQAEAAAQAEQRRVQEQQRLQAEQKQQEERKQQETAAQQAAERKQQEDRQREEQRRSEDQQRQQELAAQQQAAESQRQDQARLDAESEMVMAYTAIIHDLVQRQWSRPPSARNGMVVVLRIRLAPTGDIVGNVEVVRSSGDYAFDRAAETAVLKVNRFSELQGMPPRMFERNFRSLLLTFRPEDLLN
jgi:colicin import membrane protein